MVRNEGDALFQVIVCPPVHEYFKIKEKATHNIEKIADKDKAKKQHYRLQEILRNTGAEVIELEELVDHPNSVFTRDAAVVTPEGYIKLRMGLESRRGEGEWIGRKLQLLDIPCIGGIEEPGTAEGGDIILAGQVVFIGSSKRTNREGVEQLKKTFKHIGFEVRVAEIPLPRLHIGGMMSMIAPDRIICCQELFPAGFFKGYDTINVPAQTFISGNVICLKKGIAVAEKGNKIVIDKLADAKIKVHGIDLSEFVKGRGGPTCLTMPVKRG